MGQAKIKQYNRKQFLLQHTRCCYCGAPSTTTDHCPPRSFFLGRKWPEGYEFPACDDCNQEARLDEQLLGVLTRISVGKKEAAVLAREEWEKLVDGVRNNQPDVVAEWLSLSRNEIRRSYRKRFGNAGDRLRNAGWGALHVGPLTRVAIVRFVVKLGKALYYRHLEQPFDGTLSVRHISGLEEGTTPELFQDLIKLAPSIATPERANQPLTDQFIYRFNASSEMGLIYAVVGFNAQMIFQLLALRQDTYELVKEKRASEGRDIPQNGMVRCRIRFPAEVTQEP